MIFLRKISSNHHRK